MNLYKSNTERFSLDGVLKEYLTEEQFPLLQEANQKYYRTLNEDEKLKFSDKLMIKLIKPITVLMNINSTYRLINKSRGNITKLGKQPGDMYKVMKSSVLFLDRFVNSNLNTLNAELKGVYNEIKMCFGTLEKRSKYFMDGYEQKNALVIFLYKSIIVALTNVIAAYMSNAIEVDDSNPNDIKFIQRKKYNSKFFKVEKNNDLKLIKTMNDLFSNHKENAFFNFQKTLKKQNALTEDAIVIGAVAASVGVVTLLLFLIRSVCFLQYYFRQDISEKLNECNEMLVLNSSTLGYSRKDEKTRAKQLKWAKRLKTWSAKFNVDYTSAIDKAKEKEKDDNKKMDIKNEINVEKETNNDEDVAGLNNQANNMDLLI